MPDDPVRSRRTAATHDTPDPVQPSATVVVGDGVLAELLALRLAATHVPALASDPAEAAEAVAGADVVVVLGHAAQFDLDTGRAARREHVVEQARRATAAARTHGARVVGIGSAVVCGARPGRAVVADDEPADPASADVPGVVGTLAAFEAELADAAAAAGQPVTVLRPAAVVGPGIDTFVTRHFEAPRLLAVRGTVRDWQLVHVDDVAAAVRVVVARGLTGYLGVGALRDDGEPDVIAAPRVAALAGKRLLTLPESSAFALAESLHRVGAVPAPPAELAFVVYPWTVAATTVRDAGWRPAWSTAACLAGLVEGLHGGLTVAGRRVGARDAAALGAAGAAVALLGTAAVWRQARGRH